MTAAVRVDFCGELSVADPARPFTIGREGDLVIDDNPYLHRRFLRVEFADGMWWLANLGTALSVTVADDNGLMQAWLCPGARVPLVFHRTMVWFTAGPTTYDFVLELDDPPFVPAIEEASAAGGKTVGATISRTTFTPAQLLLVLALAEPLLRRGERGSGAIPSNNEAAKRLGWTYAKFNRKLDNVCQKLVKHGVPGLHGDQSALASNRRARLVEYAVAARLVTRDDLGLLDRPYMR